MNKQKIELYRKALKKFSKIYPVGSHDTFEKCFTTFRGNLYFWFDTPDHSTHLISEKLRSFQKSAEH